MKVEDIQQVLGNHCWKKPSFNEFLSYSWRDGHIFHLHDWRKNIVSKNPFGNFDEYPFSCIIMILVTNCPLTDRKFLILEIYKFSTEPSQQIIFGKFADWVQQAPLLVLDIPPADLPTAPSLSIIQIHRPFFFSIFSCEVGIQPQRGNLHANIPNHMIPSLETKKASLPLKIPKIGKWHFL